MVVTQSKTIPQHKWQNKNSYQKHTDTDIHVRIVAGSISNMTTVGITIWISPHTLVRQLRAMKFNSYDLNKKRYLNIAIEDWNINIVEIPLFGYYVEISILS